LIFDQLNLRPYTITSAMPDTTEHIAKSYEQSTTLEGGEKKTGEPAVKKKGGREGRWGKG
jgi:hypothetical protein